MNQEIEYLDLNLHGNDITNNIITNPLQLFFQEIEIAVKTGPGEIWGIKDAININRYLFNRYVTITQIRNEIKNFINKYCQHAYLFQYNLSVETIKGPDNKDLLYITITVPNESDEYDDKFVQKFLLGS